MNSREIILNKLNKKSNGESGIWIGNPDPRTFKIYLDALGLTEIEEFYSHYGDDCRWFPVDGEYKAPDGRPAFDFENGKKNRSLGGPGFFADCENVKDVENYPWPEAKYCDFTKSIEYIKKFKDKAVFTGLWSPFFHIVAEYMGMEEYFVKMYTNPDVVQCLTEKIVDFYVEANDKFFAELGDNADTFFFGNDFGTQRDLLISVEMWEKFIMPSFKRLIDVGKKHNKKIMLHSCGAISRVIPTLIDAGIDALHPLQAKADGMEPKKLFAEFGKDIAFMGGLDTQDLLVNATPQVIKETVKQLKEDLGANYIVSPSHECILPNVPLANIEAMIEAARE